MEPDNQLDPADQVLAAALKSIAPVAVSIDPVVAAFIAGRSAARKQNRIWQGTALLAVVLSCSAWLRPQVRDNRADARSETAVVSTAEQSVGPISPLSALSLQRAVLEHGMAGLPQMDVSSNRPVNVQELYN